MAVAERFPEIERTFGADPELVQPINPEDVFNGVDVNLSIFDPEVYRELRNSYQPLSQPQIDSLERVYGPAFTGRASQLEVQRSALIDQIDNSSFHHPEKFQTGIDEVRNLRDAVQKTIKTLSECPQADEDFVNYQGDVRQKFIGAIDSLQGLVGVIEQSRAFELLGVEARQEIKQQMAQLDSLTGELNALAGLAENVAGDLPGSETSGIWSGADEQAVVATSGPIDSETITTPVVAHSARAEVGNFSAGDVLSGLVKRKMQEGIS